MELAEDHALHERGELLTGRRIQRAGRRLDGVHQHQDARLLRTRSHARVLEGRLGQAKRVALLLAAMPEELDHARAMVRVGELHHRLGDAALAQDARALDHVRHDGVGADVRREPIVRRRLAAHQVLHEVLGLNALAEVVVVGAHPREQRVRADRHRGTLGQVRHGAGVLPGAGRVLLHLAQQRLVEIGQIHQASTRDRSEGEHGDALEQEGDEARQHAARDGGQRLRMQRIRDLRGDVLSPLEDHARGEEDHARGKPRGQPRRQHAPRLNAIAERDRARQSRRQVDGHADQAKTDEAGGEEGHRHRQHQRGSSVQVERAPERERPHGQG